MGVKETIMKMREDLKRLEEKLKEEKRKFDQIRDYWNLNYYEREQRRRPQAEAEIAVTKKRAELTFYLSSLAIDGPQEPPANDEMREEPIFSNVEDLIDHVFRESPSTLDSRFERSRPLTMAPSPLSSSSTSDSRSCTSWPLTVVASPLARPSASDNRFDVGRPLAMMPILLSSPLISSDHSRAYSVDPPPMSSPRASSLGDYQEDMDGQNAPSTEITPRRSNTDQVPRVVPISMVSPLTSPQNHFQRGIVEKNACMPTRMSSLKYWKEGRAAPGSHIDESAEESEKSSLKPNHWPLTSEERLSLERFKNRGEQHRQCAEEQIAVAKMHQPEFHSIDELVEWAMGDQEEGEEQLNPEEHQRAPGRLSIPYDTDDLLDEIMIVVPESLLQFAGVGHERKPYVRYLLWKRTRFELNAIHRKLFEHHPCDLPPYYASEGFIRNERILEFNRPMLQAGLEDSDSDSGIDKKQEMIQKVSKSRLAQTQPNRPSPERKALTNAEKKRRKLWGTLDLGEIQRLKEERKTRNREKRRRRDANYRRDKRQNEMSDDSSSASQGEQ